MNDTITTTGLVATEPRVTTTGDGLAITSFRLASSQRKYNRSTQRWDYADTNWYTVTGFRHLASNLGVSIAKGDLVLVTGRMRIREWENGGRSGTVVEIDADSVGHDLTWGTTAFTRTVGSRSTPHDGESAAAGEQPAAEADGSEVNGTSQSEFVPEDRPASDKRGWASASPGGDAAGLA